MTTRCPPQTEPTGTPTRSPPKPPGPAALPGSERPQAPTARTQFPRGHSGNDGFQVWFQDTLAQEGWGPPVWTQQHCHGLPSCPEDRQGTPAQPPGLRCWPRSLLASPGASLYQELLTRPLHPSLLLLKCEPPGHSSVAPRGLPLHPLFPCGFLGSRGSWGHFLSPRQ